MYVCVCTGESDDSGVHGKRIFLSWRPSWGERPPGGGEEMSNKHYQKEKRIWIRTELFVCVHKIIPQLSSFWFIGEFQARSDGELSVPWGVNDGVGGAGVPADQSAALSVRPVRVAARRCAGGGREPALGTPRQQCWNLSVPRTLSRRLLSGSVL